MPSATACRLTAGCRRGELASDTGVTARQVEHLVAAARTARTLDERERMIMRARFGLDGPERTLRELALVLGVSAERVRQIEGRALDKLREAVDG
jgi:DNA-directed RNA polymerase sigma subunit (sigma70/sigma32)